jgi:uncharacterized protein (DUF1697 family)
MIYVALLRGINVGGNNKVSMSQLKLAFERAGMTDVSTYINSGNIIFTDTTHDPAELVRILENAIEMEFGFAVKVLLRDIEQMRTTVAAIPDAWTNGDTMKCDVMFLWKEADTPDIIDRMQFNPEIEETRYVSGAVLWSIDRKNVTRSKMTKVVGTLLYKQMTIRNCNTTRKLLQLMESIS